jgi:hypothetical protein
MAAHPTLSNQFDKLDDALIGKTFGHVSSPPGVKIQVSRLRCGAVCKRFKQVEEQTKSLCWEFVTSEDEERFLRWIISNHISDLTKVVLDAFAWRFKLQHKAILMAALLPSLKTLREITISVGDFTEDKARLLLQMVQACPSLQLFSFVGNQVLSFAFDHNVEFPFLHKFGEYISPSFDVLPTLQRPFPALQSLRVTQHFESGGKYELSSESLTYLTCELGPGPSLTARGAATSCERVVHFDVSGPRLHTVDITYDDKGDKCVTLKCPELQRLTMNSGGKIDGLFKIVVEGLEAPLALLKVTDVPWGCIQELLESVPNQQVGRIVPLFSVVFKSFFERILLF